MRTNLREKISAALTPEQKAHRARNLLQDMRRDGDITPNRRGPGALWELAKPQVEATGLADPEGGPDKY